MGTYDDILGESPAAEGSYNDIVSKPKAPQKSAANVRGRSFPSGAAGGMTALQGPLFGFGDELAGAMNAWGRAINNDFDLKGNYLEGRDMYRGANEAARERNPGLMTATSLAASAPLIAAAPVMKGALGINATAYPVTAKVVQAAIPAAGYGGLSAAGESNSDTFSGVLRDTAKGAATSAAIAGASQPVIMGMGSVGRSMASRMSSSSADDYAEQKIGEALLRDARGTAVERDASKAISQAEARLRRLGKDGAVVDAGGQSTKQLLDTAVTSPGKSKDAAERFIRARQAGRGDRIAAEAEKALGTQGRAYVQSIDAFDEARRQAAKPLYDQLSGVTVQIDDDVIDLLNRSKAFHGEAERLAQVSGMPARLSDLQPGQAVPLRTLDTLKQTLFDAADAAKRQGNKKMGAAIDDLRTSLISKLDDVSPKAQDGQSIYKLARDAWAGPSSSISAAEAGRRAMREDAISLAEMMRGMSASEIEAFKIGATQAIREQAGTQSGQTKLLNMWMNPSTSGKLREIFGNNYRQFAAAIAKEGKKKAVESVGRGSQTASRLAAADDLDISAIQDAASATAGVARGNLLSMAPLLTLARRMQTPEPVRDRIGNILLTQGDDGVNALAALRRQADALNAERARRAAMAGGFSGVLRVPTD